PKVDPYEGEGEVVLPAGEGTGGPRRGEGGGAAEELEPGDRDPRRLCAQRLAGRIVDARPPDGPEPEAPPGVLVAGAQVPLVPRQARPPAEGAADAAAGP